MTDRYEEIRRVLAMGPSSKPWWAQTKAESEAAKALLAKGNKA